MTTMLSLILAFMLSIGGSPAVSVSPVNSIGPESGVSHDITGKPRLGEFQKIYPVETRPNVGNPRLVLNLSFQYKKSPLIDLNQGFNMNPINFLDPYGLKHTKEQIDELMRVRRDKGIAEARNWIDKNTSFTNEDRLALHMKLLVGVYDPEKVEAEKYKTNWWTVMWDTIDGVGYDVAGRTYEKLADAALNRNSGSFLSFMFDLATMGGGGGLLKHYIPIGINFLKSKFPFLNKSVGELVKKGTKKVKNFFDKIFGRGQTSASRTTIATEGGPSLPFKNPRLKDQIETVIESFDETGKPPSGVWQGGRRGQPRGLFLNDKGKLPAKPRGYYTESDVWPGSPRYRNAERLIFGEGGEVYYTADHYKTFVRIR